MNCNEAIERLTDSLIEAPPGAAHGRPGGPATAPSAELAAHLAGCDACRAEAEALRRVWEELGRLPEEMPGAEMQRRFAAMLAPHLLELRRGHSGSRVPGARALERWGAALEGWLERWLPRRALAQAGLAAATLALGVLIGAGRVPGLVHGSGGAAGEKTASEIGALREEVRSLSQLVTLSLLKQDSVSERLRGVSFGRQAGAGDDRVLQALLDTLRHDPDVNVRLAAVDALAPALVRPVVRDQLLTEVARQRSPMVQIALVDLLLTRDRAGSQRQLQDLAASPSLDETVRGYLHNRLRS